MRQKLQLKPGENKMGVMKEGPLLFNVAFPMVISMLMQACYNIVDSIFVAQINETALTAVSLAFPIQMLMIAVAIGTGVGLNSLVSRRLGERDFAGANQAATHGFCLLIISALVFVVFGFVLVRPFFSLFADDAQILDYGVEYLSICSIFGMGIFMQIYCERIIQSTGNAVYPMVIQLVGAIVNIILDPIMIFGYLGFPAMGVAGAAIATVVGQWIGMGLGFYFLFRKKHDVQIRFKGFRFDKTCIKNIYAVGAPSVVMNAMGSVMVFFMNMILIYFSTVAVAVFGIYFKLNSIVFMPVFGICNGAMSILAYNYGARRRDRLVRVWKLQILACFTLLFVGVCLFHLFPAWMLQCFDASPEMLELGVPALRWISTSFLLAGICIPCSTIFQAVGRGVYSMWMSLLRQLIVLLPVAYIFSHSFGLEAVWFAWPIAECVSLAYCIIMVRRMFKKIIDPLDRMAPVAG